MPELTVVTYNVYGAVYRDALAGVVRALAPDVLVVNETPKTPFVWRRHCDELARSWGLRRVAGGRSAGSNMICVSSRVHVDAARARRLRQPRFTPRRGVVSIQGSVDGAPFGVVGVHLSLMRWSRPGEAAEALADVGRLRDPVLLCGDYNESPTGAVWEAFRNAGFVDHAAPRAFTSTAVDPHQRIDGLLARGATVLRHVVPDLPPEQLAAASDHLPVLARIELDGDAASW